MILGFFGLGRSFLTCILSIVCNGDFILNGNAHDGVVGVLFIIRVRQLHHVHAAHPAPQVLIVLRVDLRPYHASDFLLDMLG